MSSTSIPLAKSECRNGREGEQSWWVMLRIAPHFSQVKARHFAMAGAYILAGELRRANGDHADGVQSLRETAPRIYRKQTSERRNVSLRVLRQRRG